jgi:carbon-monoxide dehydrogenase iron sulfur subunit
VSSGERPIDLRSDTVTKPTIVSEKMRIKVNPHLCSGCLSCMTTCSMVNESYASLSAARVQVSLRPFDGPHEITLCRQCARPRCQEACPEGAIVRDADTLHPSDDCLVVDYDRCTNCRACIEACPFGAMFWNPISARVIKCELCNGDPQCVQACPTGALAIQKGEENE